MWYSSTWKAAVGFTDKNDLAFFDTTFFPLYDNILYSCSL